MPPPNASLFFPSLSTDGEKMGKWRDEPMGALGGAAAAPYSRAANDECRICGGRCCRLLLRRRRLRFIIHFEESRRDESAMMMI